MEIPDIIGEAHVISYAVVNLSIPTGNTQHFAGDKLLGMAYGLAICKYETKNGYYLFYCDDKWIELADTWHQTIEDAQDQAEYEYAGITNNWVLK